LINEHGHYHLQRNNCIKWAVTFFDAICDVESSARARLLARLYDHMLKHNSHLMNPITRGPRVYKILLQWGWDETVTRRSARTPTTDDSQV
jgi:hypothetical protein